MQNFSKQLEATSKFYVPRGRHEASSILGGPIPLIRHSPKSFHRCELAPGIWASNFFYGSAALVGIDLLVVEFLLSHANTPHPVWLLWTSDRPVAETSTWQHTQNLQETDIHASAGTRTLNPNKRAAVDPRLRPRGHRVGFCAPVF
jgi:hypothetical protein